MGLFLGPASLLFSSHERDWQWELARLLQPAVAVALAAQVEVEVEVPVPIPIPIPGCWLY